ncbi:cob(I)yrinic acid a,c-diamide adenosyltransferase [Veillonella intestinalis]|uniref:cob(I)yrinic acid a,c-diamide adenosyltransferase n=1 Tax=Veillonella intestinalis TaxID=2941341 RepID=UPI00203DAF73|nr:cob(I)yrinic acid a,c-diamide adenosyltransferase [Veillonella intestinalis]
MRIYTKTGDKGMTRLVGGVAVAKDSDRVESYGTIDELNSWVGYAISQFSEDFVAERSELQYLQHFLFDVGTDLATPESLDRSLTLPDGAVSWLEERIDVYTEAAPEINRFILPGGTSEASMMHVARTIARRAERRIVRLQTTARVSSELVMFVNRLSDYFYALARYINAKQGREDIYYSRSAEVFHNGK